MSDAQARGWGNPDAPNYRAAHIIKVTAGGVALWVRREVAHLFQGFCDELVTRGYRLDVNADDWGYNNRDIRGRPGVKSNHAWGLAVDLNAGSNPMTENGHVISDMPDWVGDVAAAWGLFWGRNYTGRRKDPMHFEYLGTPSQVPRRRNPPIGPSPAPHTSLPPYGEREDDMDVMILIPVDDNDSPHDKDGKAYGCPMYVFGDSFMFLGTGAEVSALTSSKDTETGRSAVPVVNARPFMIDAHKRGTYLKRPGIVDPQLG